MSELAVRTATLLLAERLAAGEIVNPGEAIKVRFFGTGPIHPVTITDEMLVAARAIAQKRDPQHSAEPVPATKTKGKPKDK